MTPVNITQPGAQNVNGFILSPNSSGSRNVIKKRGRSKNVRTPIATVETWMERKKVVSGLPASSRLRPGVR